MKNLKKTILLLSMCALLSFSFISTAFAADTNGMTFSTRCNLSPGENGIIPLLMQNTDAVAHTYSLSAEKSSNQYELYFSSNGSATKRVNVPAGSRSQIDLNIKLKGNVFVNEDRLVVKAVRDDGIEKTVDISVIVNKDYAISIKNMLTKIEVISGKTAEFTVSVTNGGYKELKNIKIKPTLPYKWYAVQGIEKAISLKPGETSTFTTKVDVPSSQAAGNFEAKFTAVSDEISSDQISIPVTVKTSSNIGFLMLGILAIIAGFTLTQFKKNGRR